MPASSANATATVAPDLSDLSIRVSFELPADWDVGTTTVTQDRKAIREGRLALRLTARAGTAVLRLSASHMPLPVGLTPAVVYWSNLLGLASVPQVEEQWGAWPAVVGWSQRADVPDVLIAIAWLQIDEVVVQLQLEGPERAQLEHVWTLVRETFRCESFRSRAAHVEPSEPWWTRVQRLRDAGKLDEAIEVLQRDGDRAEASLLEAQLHGQRMREYLQDHALESARSAWRAACNCAHAYAASATSGGEGAARSLERDRLLAALGPEPESSETGRAS